MKKQFSSQTLMQQIRSYTAGLMLCAFLLVQVAESLHTHITANATTLCFQQSSDSSHESDNHSCPYCHHLGGKFSLCESFNLIPLATLQLLGVENTSSSIEFSRQLHLQPRAPPAASSLS